MRGANDHLSTGQRIAFYRGRRGLTQAMLASLVGRTEDWLHKVERGRREIQRVDILVDVARALRVSLGDLIGQPVLLEDAEGQDDVPAIRDALMTPRQLSRVLFANPASDPVPDAARTARLTEAIWAQYQAGRVGQTVAALPELIRTAQTLESHDPSPEGWACSARIHHLAATTLSKIGESDLSWIAAERAMGAADQADDPLVLASAARAGTHALLAIGRYDDALQLGKTAVEWLRPRVTQDDPSALSLMGMLNLRMAVAAARHQDRQTRNELITNATTSAEQLGEDANYWQTAFGPTNVVLHDLSTALDLGDVAYVVERGPSVSADGMPVERRTTHQIDLARAHSYLAQDDSAISALLSAESEAAQLVHHNPVVRETVRSIHRRTPVSNGGQSSEFMRLAEQCRALA